MTTTLIPQTQALTTSDILTRAHELATTKSFTYDPDTFWVGPSGEKVTGRELAAYLEAVAAILTRDGWVRRYTGGTEVDLSGDATKMSLGTMIRKGFQVLQEEFGYLGDKSLTLNDAMHQAIEEDAGDRDHNNVAARVLSTILRAGRGLTENSNWPLHDAWSERIGRTRDEVLALLAAGTEYARRYGPAQTIAA